MVPEGKVTEHSPSVKVKRLSFIIHMYNISVIRL